jgi:hypothetical protein
MRELTTVLVNCHRRSRHHIVAIGQAENWDLDQFVNDGKFLIGHAVSFVPNYQRGSSLIAKVVKTSRSIGLFKAD